MGRGTPCGVAGYPVPSSLALERQWPGEGYRGCFIRYIEAFLFAGNPRSSVPDRPLSSQVEERRLGGSALEFRIVVKPAKHQWRCAPMDAVIISSRADNHGLDGRRHGVKCSDGDGLRASLSGGVYAYDVASRGAAERRRWTFPNMPLASSNMPLASSAHVIVSQHATCAPRGNCNLHRIVVE